MQFEAGHRQWEAQATSMAGELRSQQQQHRELSRLAVSHLDAGVADVAHLLAVELLPLLTIKLLNERDDVFRPHHVDKSIAHIALVFEVDWKVEKVVGAAKLFVNGSKQHLLCVFVGNVLDHQGGTLVIACRAPGLDIDTRQLIRYELCSLHDI